MSTRAPLAAPLGLKPGNLYKRQQHENFLGWAEQQLVAKYGARRVAAGGLRVRTTLDPSMQETALAAVRGVLRQPSDPAAALVAIDPRTGAVRAMVGYLPDGTKLKFNLATQSTRTAGSSFKPFVLATAIQQGISLYSSFSGPPSLVIPEHSCDGPQGPWDVHNYADESGGYMNLLSATANSVNTIFAQLVAKVGPSNVVPVAHRMGITTNLQPVCSITLGTQPVNPLEMTDGYATLAAHGVHHAPQAFELVRAPNSSVLGRLTTRGDQAISSSVADQVTYALEGVIQHGTGTAASIGRPAAGKTGTAENFQDAWFCGYVPQLAACVWVGYPKAEIPLIERRGCRRRRRRHAPRGDLARLHVSSDGRHAGTRVPDAADHRDDDVRHELLHPDGPDADDHQHPAVDRCRRRRRRAATSHLFPLDRIDGAIGDGDRARRARRITGAASPASATSFVFDAARLVGWADAERRFSARPGNRRRAARRWRRRRFRALPPTSRSAHSHVHLAGWFFTSEASARTTTARRSPRSSARQRSACPSASSPGPARRFPCSIPTAAKCARCATRSFERNAHRGRARRERAADALPPREARASSTTASRTSAASI